MKTILQGLAIIFTLIASFLGNLYFLNGDIIISAFISSIIVVVLYFLQETFIKKKSIISKNKFSSTSIVLWTLYLLLSIPITFSLIHALNVELNEKEDIQQAAAMKQDDLTNMLKDYSKKYDGYLALFQEKAQTKLYTFQNDRKNKALMAELSAAPYETPTYFFDDTTVTANQQAVEAKKKKLTHFKIIEDSVNERVVAYNNKYQNVFSTWSRLQISIAAIELNKVLQQNHEQIVNEFKRLAESTYPTYLYPYNKEVIAINHPIDLWNKHKPYLLLVVVFFFHLLILLPYIIEPVAGTYLDAKKSKKAAGGGIQL